MVVRCCRLLLVAVVVCCCVPQLRLLLFVVVVGICCGLLLYIYVLQVAVRRCYRCVLSAGLFCLLLLVVGCAFAVVCC